MYNIHLQNYTFFSIIVIACGGTIMNKRIGKSQRAKKIWSKTAMILAFVALCFTLVACDPSTYRFEPDELDEVVKVELIAYDNPDQKHFFSWVPDHTADLKPFDNSAASVLETLDDDKIPDFIDALCETDVLYWYFAYDSPNEICLKLTYSDDSFLIVWSDYKNKSFAGYIGKFTADGEVDGFIGSFSALGYYTELVNDFFHTQIIVPTKK